jgi:hypothetical protein
MPQITVYVRNDTTDNQNAHVFDQFASGRREVGGSPFALASKETSPGFGVNADISGKGVIEYACDGGPSTADIDVYDQKVVSIG